MKRKFTFFCYGEESKSMFFWEIYDILAFDKTYTDSWYIFFNTDKEIDNLLEINVTFKQYDYHIQFGGRVKMDYAITEDEVNNRINGITSEQGSEKTTISYHDQEIKTITPGKTKVYAKDNWWSGYATKYQSIDNIMDLREYNHKDDNGNPFVFTEQANKYTWGVNFLTTSKTCEFKDRLGGSVTTSIIDGSGVSNTAILRLKYETNGLIKNAYAVDVPTDDFAGNTANVDIEGVFEKILMLIGILILVVVFSVLSPIFGILFKGIIAIS